MWFSFFCISMAINLLLAFYVRWLLKTVSVINQDIESVTILLNNFSEHLAAVHELEMFYGDETLNSLMLHAKELTERLQEIDLILNEEKEFAEEEETKENQK